jgi:hypothetical protein
LSTELYVVSLQDEILKRMKWQFKSLIMILDKYNVILYNIRVGYLEDN